jgi:UDP-glucose 4-epimerase
MKILVLGSEGFIGKHCLKHFIRKGYSVSGIDLLDLKNSAYPYYKISRLQPDFQYFLEKIDFNVCINASGSGSVPNSVHNPLNDFEANTIDTFHVLDAIRKKNASIKYLNISSAAVYGNPRNLPIVESDEIKPLSPYGWHKYYSELICKEYSTLYNVATCSIRPFSVYGPGLRKQLFWDLYLKSEKQNEIELFGSGDESRDFIYVDDLINAIDIVLQNAQMKGEIYNLASGIETSIYDASTLFLKLLNSGNSLFFNGEVREGDPLNWKADISLLKSLGFKPEVSLSQGLLNYINWLNNSHL